MVELDHPDLVGGMLLLAAGVILANILLFLHLVIDKCWLYYINRRRRDLYRARSFVNGYLKLAEEIVRDESSSDALSEFMLYTSRRLTDNKLFYAFIPIIREILALMQKIKYCDQEVLDSVREAVRELTPDMQPKFEKAMGYAFIALSLRHPLLGLLIRQSLKFHGSLVVARNARAKDATLPFNKSLNSKEIPEEAPVEHISKAVSQWIVKLMNIDTGDVAQV